MKITFLGSAAAEGIPTPYCDCRACAHARQHKGRNIRKRSCYLINDDLLVDMGPDLFNACAQHDVDLLKVKTALVTHSHSDHFFAPNLSMRTRAFRKYTTLDLLTVVAPPSVLTLLNQEGADLKNCDMTTMTCLPFQTFDLAPYKVKSLKADHQLNIGDAVNYIIDDGNKKVLIASDTGVYDDEVWPHLQDLKLDLLVIECTVATDKGSNRNHLTVEGVKTMVERMKSIGALTNDTPIYVTHFSHHHSPPHDEMASLLEDIGMHCVYDGMQVTL